MTNIKPVIKWVGGKRSILHELRGRMPRIVTKYFEPFIGGGALCFSLQHSQSYISDTNTHLITMYTAIRDDVQRVINFLKLHKELHNKEYYYNIRSQFNTETEKFALAAMFIYINKTCFNGLYRVNRSGGFNVPIGNYKSPAILDEDALNTLSKYLQTVEIHNHGFSECPIEKNAFYYFDPPYHETYSNYSAAGFNDEAHITLAEMCHKIHNNGSLFMLSNSNTAFINELYSAFSIGLVSALRSVSRKGNQRGRVDEVLITNYTVKSIGF